MSQRSRIVLLPCATLLVACSGPGPQLLEGRAYPDGVVQQDVLDVQVFQDQQSVRLTNTTPRPLGPGWLWLNGWFSAPIDAIDIGQTIVVPLRDFRDEFGQTPRAGGFWAARDAVDVVLAQIESADPVTGAARFHGLVVVGDDER